MWWCILLFVWGGVNMPLLTTQVLHVNQGYQMLSSYIKFARENRSTVKAVAAIEKNSST